MNSPQRTRRRRALSWPLMGQLGEGGPRNRAVLGVLLETRISRAACSALDLAHLQFDLSALTASGRKGGVHTLSDGFLADLERYLNEARPLLVASASFSQVLSSSTLPDLSSSLAARATERTPQFRISPSLPLQTLIESCARIQTKTVHGPERKL